ncbi:hypothetical protein [Elizabethkingia anophelis]|uniref:Uncharacterized protein n=3 Tax=Elizabethkingia anophelis TaxID=1117645 RepID=A0A1T3E2G2_9FLAO|nr:hypothetical protein [Elizabethkingia anophelis]AMR42939.1 hypothetical protein A2T74_16940 [Elizabethkingia anophelis]AMX49581.1 hypothetical protein A4C56_16940 [Elizabethkingia anophelis]AMX53037.1 hypothetical protein A2T72_16935 [Elizabethkingia anophelis]AMX56431.1 hypothetical protein A2T59_16940 [Elizabethkingia anophelis]AQW89873.1 hypothetical protein BBD28_04010 [Elizabethkingia anophelis]
MNKIFFYFLLFLFTNCASQTQSLKNTSREHLQKIMNEEFSNRVNNKTLVYAVDDKWYLIIDDKGSYYEEFYIKADGNKIIKEKLDKINKPNSMLDNAFDLSNYKYDYIDFSSDGYKDYKLAQGNKTYFCVIDKEKYHGEFNLSVIVDPIPIDKNLNKYLMTKLFKEISNNKATH